MSNGATNPLKTADDVRVWCVGHRAEDAANWHHQEGWKGKQEAWMLSQERRIQKLENRGAWVTGFAVSIGSVVAILTSLIADKLGG